MRVRRSRRSTKPAPRPNISSKPVRARSGWTACARIGRFTVLLVLLLLSVSGTTFAYRRAAPSLAGWFEVQSITVIGANQVTRREVLEHLALPPHQNLLSVNLRLLAARVESHPWVKRVTVTRVLPHTLAVHLVERRAAAVLRASSVALLLDEDGQVLSSFSAADDLGLPVLVGINPKGVLEKESRSLHAARRGIELAGLLGRTFQGRPEVDVGNPDNVVAYVEGFKLQFGESSFEEKWDRYQKLERYLPNGSGHGRVENRHDIDLRYPGKVIIRERG